jgi:hypothetical protein
MALASPMIGEIISRPGMSELNCSNLEMCMEDKTARNPQIMQTKNIPFPNAAIRGVLFTTPPRNQPGLRDLALIADVV